MFERWRERAAHDVGLRGLVVAGYRFACRCALAVFVTAGLVWLRDYLTSGYLPMLPVLGNASAVTFVLATLGFAVAAGLWLADLAGPARVVAAGALAAWLVTAVVFQLVMGGTMPLVERTDPAQAALPAWTSLAVLAALAVRQERPATPIVTAGGLGVVLVAGLAWTASGLVPDGPAGYLMAAEPPVWPPAVLDRGFDTLHTMALTGWALLLAVGIAAWRVDRRLLVAAVWLVPFVLLSQLASLTPAVLVLALLVAVGLPPVVLVATRGRS